MKLSESKTTSGVFTYYTITEGERGVAKMLMHYYGGGGGGWPCDDLGFFTKVK